MVVILDSPNPIDHQIVYEQQLKCKSLKKNYNINLCVLNIKKGTIKLLFNIKD
jgi:hypothetical protein